MDRHLHIGRAVWDFGAARLTRGTRPITLTALEAKLLGYLADRIGEVVPTRQLLRDVWGYAPRTQTRAVENAVSRLRKKLAFDGDQIQTVYGRGYQLLPSGEDDLVGRQDLVEGCAQLLARHRLVNLHGPGGIGKTAVARAVSQLWAEGTWVPLSEPASEEAFRAILMKSIGVEAQPGVSIATALGAIGRALLVIDGAEHLGPWIVSSVRAWQREALSLHVLLTSRVHFQDEALLEVPPLDPDAAVELLRLRLAGQNVVEALPDGAARRIVDRIDRLPLAIELGAGRLRTLHHDDLLAQVKRHAAILDGPDRRLTRSLERSWELVGPTEQRCLCAASLFGAGCTVDSLCSVVDLDAVTVVTALDGLGRASLTARRGRRYVLLDVVRSFVSERVTADLEAAFAGWVLGQVDAVIARRRRGEVTSRDDLVELASCITRTLHVVDAEETRARLLIGLWLHDLTLGPLRRCEPWLAGLNLEALAPSTAADVLSARARIAYAQADRQTAADLAGRAVEHARRAGDPTELARCMVLQVDANRTIRAKSEQLEQARALVELVDSTDATREVRAAAYHGLCRALALCGLQEESLQCAYRALALIDERDPLTLQFAVSIALAHFWLGRSELARDVLRDALAAAEAEGLDSQAAHLWMHLGDAHINLDERAQAREAYGEASRLAERTGQSGLSLASQIGLAGLEERPDHAKAAFDRLRARALALEDFARAAVSGMQLGNLHHFDGELDKALAAYQDSLSHAERCNWTEVASLVRSCLVVLLAETRSREEARRELERVGPGGEAAVAVRDAVQAALDGRWESVDAQLRHLTGRFAEQTRLLVGRLRPG